MSVLGFLVLTLGAAIAGIWPVAIGFGALSLLTLLSHRLTRGRISVAPDGKLEVEGDFIVEEAVPRTEPNEVSDSRGPRCSF